MDSKRFDYSLFNREMERGGRMTKQRWIPVSERLPEEETTVLICTDQGDIDASRIFSYSDGTWEWFASSWCYGEIIAWMPLPEPYIESEGE